MKLILVIALVGSAAAATDVYEKYANYDVDDILNSIRLLKSYAQCFLGEGKCTAAGKDFKNWLPEGIQTGCSKCSERQKILLAKLLKATQENLPTEWDRLNKIYDPELQRKEEVQVFIKKYAP